MLAGDGELHEEFKSLAQELSVDSQRLIFLGLRQDVPNLLCAADLLAFPSNFEGLGTSVLDAIHGGCAVAATKVGGIPEMIHHGETGLLSEVGDANGHCQNLNQLLDSQDLQKDLANAAKALIDREFSVESMVRGNLQVYQSALKS